VIRYAIAVLVVVLFGAACSKPVAATVNGADIDTATLENVVVSDTELTADDLSAILTGLIQWEAAADAARDDFGIDPTDEEIAAFQDQLLADAGLTLEDYLSQQKITEEGFERWAKQLLVGQSVVAEFEDQVVPMSEEVAQQALDENLASWTMVCASHILVDTEEEANAALERLDAGEDFATLAGEISTDAGSALNGGDLGCAAPAGYVTEFANAAMTGEIGAVTGPIETQYGFHLILVGSRDVPSTEAVISADSDSQLSDLTDAWYLAAISAADVTVDSEYGVWVTDPTPQVVPPES